MAKEVKKQEAEGAPEYMVQYTSLMMLLLAFFIAMLANAKFDEQLAGFEAGVGSIRNALGVSGGLGILPYIHAIKGDKSKQYPNPTKPKAVNDKENVAIGHSKDKIEKNTLYQKDYMKINKTVRGKSLRITTPIVFAPGSATLDSKTKLYVDKIGGVLNSFAGCTLTIRAYCRSTGDRTKDEELAMRRAASIARYLEEQSGVSRDRIKAVGYSSLRYFGRADAKPSFQNQGVSMFIQKQGPSGAVSTRENKIREM